MRCRTILGGLRRLLPQCNTLNARAERTVIPGSSTRQAPPVSTSGTHRGDAGRRWPATSTLGPAPDTTAAWPWARSRSTSAIVSREGRAPLLLVQPLAGGRQQQVGPAARGLDQQGAARPELRAACAWATRSGSTARAVAVDSCAPGTRTTGDHVGVHVQLHRVHPTGDVVVAPGDRHARRRRWPRRCRGGPRRHWPGRW